MSGTPRPWVASIGQVGIGALAAERPGLLLATAHAPGYRDVAFATTHDDMDLIVTAVNAYNEAEHLDEFQCGQCGDWLLPEDLEGHCASEGRVFAAPTAGVDLEVIYRTFVHTLRPTGTLGRSRTRRDAVGTAEAWASLRRVIDEYVASLR